MSEHEKLVLTRELSHSANITNPKPEDRPPLPPTVGRAGTPIDRMDNYRGGTPEAAQRVSGSAPRVGSNPRASEGSTARMILPVPPLSVGGRDGTPVKLAHRDSTPDGSNRAGSASRTGSAPRSSSAARATSAGRVNLAKAVFDVNNTHKGLHRTASARRPSRRKERQLEGHGMLQRQALMLERMARGDALFSKDGSSHYYEDNDDEGDEWDSALSSMRVDWRTQFSKLFEAGNEDAAETFRRCLGGSSGSGSGSGYDPTFSVNVRPVRRDEWALAESAWINHVEKRLRTVTLRCLRERDDLHLAAFLAATEAVVMFCCEKREVPPEALVPPALSTYLAEPLRLEMVTVPLRSRNSSSSSSSSNSSNKKNNKKTSNSSSGRSRQRVRTQPFSAAARPDGEEQIEVEKKREEEEEEHETILNIASSGDSNKSKQVQCLRLAVPDSLRRLTLHALCQFYSLKCRSSPSDGADAAKITYVTIPDTIGSSSKKQRMLAGKVSLSGFLTVCSSEGV